MRVKMTNSIPECITAQIGKYTISLFPKTMKLEIELKTQFIIKKMFDVNYETIMTMFYDEDSTNRIMNDENFDNEKDLEEKFLWIEKILQKIIMSCVC